VLPGFHTPAETSLMQKRIGLGGGTGEEVFLCVCGLMASGSRTILLSRWRVGGQSTVELMREFVQELPHSAANVAWRRSVELAGGRALDPATEPRLRTAKSADGLVGADHPFFWAGYLLVDTGLTPHAEEPAAKPAP
jgi:CHAT domain-containing protein